LDEVILKQLQDSPEKGLRLLMDTYMGLVYTIIAGKLKDVCSKEDIEECASEVFYEIFRSRLRIDLGQSSLKTFIALVAKRKAINRYYKGNRHSQYFVEITDEELADLASTEYGPPGAYAEKETRTTVIDSIQSLGDPDREIMIRKYYFGQSTKEVSSALKLKPATVDKKVSRGLEKLRKILKGLL